MVEAVSFSEVVSNKEFSQTVWTGSLTSSSSGNFQLLVSSVRSRRYLCNMSKEIGSCW
jgi:hypothetical protein